MANTINKIPQLFKIDLKTDAKHIAAIKPTPEINCGGSLKRLDPVQCTNCHDARTYFTHCPVGVVCGGLCETASWPIDKLWRNHTANYKGCLVFEEIKSRLNLTMARQGADGQHSNHSALATVVTFLPSTEKFSYQAPIGTDRKNAFAISMQTVFQPNHASITLV